MQEIHSMGGTRFFGGGDRRLRPHHHHGHHQALKCPRCDSLNTKFCYYNNYNLSQPRHFCKNCRRYWTKGGVLRNVPVGGGCRKSKRSNKTTKNTTSSSETPPQTTSSQPPPDNNSNSHSSSESSNLNAATTGAAAAATELNSDSSNNNNNNNNNNLHESKLLIHENNPSGLETGALEQGAGDCGGIFAEIGTFTSLIASSSANNDALAFGFGGGLPDATSFQWQHQKLPESLSGGGGGSLLDHGDGTVTVDLSALQSKTGHGGFGALDWQGGADQGLFDLPNAVDQAYWSHTQWSDQDNSALFHLP